MMIPLASRRRLRRAKRVSPFFAKKSASPTPVLPHRFMSSRRVHAVDATPLRALRLYSIIDDLMKK